MILLARDVDGIMVVTASEKAVTFPTVYTITFTHDVTKGVVVIEDAVDTSSSQDRYNQFSVNSTLFSEQDNGFYTYKITDQDNNLLEVGKMKLQGEKVIPVQYLDTPTEYTTYGK